MPKINLLYVITKLELGGAQKQLLSVVKGIDKERYRIFLFTACEGLLIEETSSITGLTLIKSRYLERTINPLKDLLALIEIYRFIKKNNIEIVHTHSSKAGVLGRFAARLANVKTIIHTVHGWSFHDYQLRWKQKFFIWLERLSAYFTNTIIVVSYHDKQKGLNNHIGPEDKYTLIRYGINYADFSTGEQKIKEELGINSNELVVGMVSCFKPQKSPQDFIKLSLAVSQTLPNVKFLLVGDGILRKQIQKLISRLKLQNRVILTGWRRDIPKILSVIDVFVLTSLWEGLPITVLEAIVSAKPVVATNTGGIQEVVSEGKNGFLVKPGDTESLSERLMLLLRNKNLRKDMGQNSKRLLNLDFSEENMVKNTQDLYDDLICRPVICGQIKEGIWPMWI